MSGTPDDESEEEMARADVAYGERAPDRTPEQTDDDGDTAEQSE